MDLGDAGTRAKFILHDRDASFTQGSDAVFQAAGIRVIRSAVQAPRMNSITERWIGSCRRELLDRTLIWNQRHLMMVLRSTRSSTIAPAAPRPGPGRATRPCRIASPTWIISGSGGIPRGWRHPRISPGGIGFGTYSCETVIGHHKTDRGEGQPVLRSKDPEGVEPRKCGRCSPSTRQPASSSVPG